MTASAALKRGIDVVVASLALLILSPVIALVALLTLLAHGRPILFRQVRVGRNGARFTLGKFRTMTNERDASGALLPDEARVTATGRFLRRFRLDELPSFVAVISGRMSLVGPRPLPPYILETIPGSAERHRVQPGFTGLAQVSGNTKLNNQEKIALDLLYADTWSVAGDAVILLKTVTTIVKGEARNEPLIQSALARQRQHSPETTAEGVRGVQR